MSLIFFFIVLVFNFPGLILYLILRPEIDEDHFLYLENNEVVNGTQEKQSSNSAHAGVDVPILNFVNENGEVNLTFQLKINKLSDTGNVGSGNYQVSVDIPKTNNNMTLPTSQNVIGTQTEVKEESRVEVIPEVMQTVNAKPARFGFSTFKSKITSKFSSIKPSLKIPSISKKSEVVEVSANKDSEVENNKNPQAHNNHPLKKNKKDKKHKRHR